MLSDPTPSGRHTLILVLLTALGLIGIGRLAEATWIRRPIPSELPEIGARTEQAAPFLLVVIDGLHERAFNDPEAMPWLRRFGLRGVSGIALTGEPTLTAPCVRAIVCGRRPDVISGFQNFTAKPVPGNLIEYLVNRGGVPAHGGDAAIYQLCRPAFKGARVYQVPDRGPTDQGETDARAVPFVLDAIDAGCDVVSMHLTKVDHAGHKYGASGKEYWHACTVVDDQIRRVAERFLARHPDATVLVASDHGVSVRGTHGGGELSARRAPFVLVGPQFVRVGGVEVDQSALAPTVAMALGLPQPPLADAPPRPDLTTLPRAQTVAALDAYVAARAFVAQHASAEGVDFISKRRAELSTQAASGAGDWSALAERVNEFVRPAQSWLAVFTLLLAWFFVACLLHLARGPPVHAHVAWPLGVALVLASLLVLGLFASLIPTTEVIGGLVVMLACGVALAARPQTALRVPPLLVAGACLAAIPVLMGAGHTFQSGFTHPDTAAGAGSRIWLVLAASVFAVGLLVRPAASWSRLRDRFASDPTPFLAIVGAAVGFGVTMRPFIDNVVHTMVLYAIAAALVVWWIANTKGARAAPAARIGFLVVGALLFGATRIAEGILGSAWTIPTMLDTTWMLLGIPLTAAAILAVPRKALAGADRMSATLAFAALVGAFAFRAIGADVLEANLGRTGVIVVSLGLNLVAIVALLATTNRGSPDGRLLVRTVAALALARRLAVFDGEYAAFALLAVGAACASRFRIPSTRDGLAKLAIALLLLRTGVFHAMGFVESLSTFDVGQVFNGLGRAVVPDAVAKEAPVTWQVQVASVQMALYMALPWILILSSVLRASERNGRGRVKQLVADLAVAFGARGAAIVAAVWIWWNNSWWMGLTIAVFLYAICDIVLVTGIALLLGAWRREPASAPEALPAAVAPAKMSA